MIKNLTLYILIAILLLVIIYIKGFLPWHRANTTQTSLITKKVESKFNQDHERARELAHRPINDIVAEVNKGFSKLSSFTGTCRPPASESDFKNAEQRLGITLPESTKQFFLSCNGIDNSGGNSPFATYSINDLKRGRDRQPSMSDKVIAIQKDYKQEVGGKIYLKKILNYNDMLKLTTYKTDITISLQDADELLFLSSNPKKIQAVGIVIKKFAGLIPGQVVDIEGSRGTIYDNIPEWIANFYTWGHAADTR